MRLRGYLLSAASAIICSLQVGCGTLFYGGSQEVRITTDPQGATVVVYPTMERVTTPVSLELGRASTYTLRVLWEGYRPESILLDSVWNEGRSTAMVLMGLGFGGLVDMGTGAYYDLVPAESHVVLTPLAEGDGTDIEQAGR